MGMKSRASTASYADRMSSTANIWFRAFRGNSTGVGGGGKTRDIASEMPAAVEGCALSSWGTCSVHMMGRTSALVTTRFPCMHARSAQQRN